jgi:hypothetical protein
MTASLFNWTDETFVLLNLILFGQSSYLPCLSFNQVNFYSHTEFQTLITYRNIEGASNKLSSNFLKQIINKYIINKFLLNH